MEGETLVRIHELARLRLSLTAEALRPATSRVRYQSSSAWEEGCWEGVEAAEEVENHWVARILPEEAETVTSPVLRPRASLRTRNQTGEEERAGVWRR